MADMRDWVPDDRPPEGIRSARLRLAAAIRQMNHLLIDADLSAEELNRAAEVAEGFVDRLERGPRGATHWGFAESSNSGNTHALFDRSPVIGVGNAIAPPLKLVVEQGEVRGGGVFGQAYEGPPGHLHGGWVAAAFDEVLGMVQSTTGNPGMTGTLTVRYRRPTPLHRHLEFVGRVDRVEGKKIFTSATLHAGEALCAEAEAVFVSVGRSRFKEMADGRRG
jgi:acyl-coenzyme A thioesterase PaaI-like protein